VQGRPAAPACMRRLQAERDLRPVQRRLRLRHLRELLRGQGRRGQQAGAIYFLCACFAASVAAKSRQQSRNACSRGARRSVVACPPPRQVPQHRRRCRPGEELAQTQLLGGLNAAAARLQAKETKAAVAENPFMGWEGWPPTTVVIVTLVLGVIFEIVFCIGFWQFWCVCHEAEQPRLCGGHDGQQRKNL
jgi:hypothetical protein